MITIVGIHPINRKVFSSICLAILLAFVTEVRGINIETVAVGDAGNQNDPSTGNLYGGVDYEYRIAKYEVTVGQYTAFLNAVAATDTYQLYDVRMANGYPITSSIVRTRASGDYNYGVIGSPYRPVTFVNWGDAARFTNWLHNNQPTGMQDAMTTERGAYTLDGAITDEALIIVTRSPDAQWFLPTENEWYKAAYYQPAIRGGDVDDYWGYPTRSNTVPYSDQPPGTDSPDPSNTANYYNDDHIANGYNDGYAVTGTPSIGSEPMTADVGSYSASVGPYGTFDQGGNISELTETQFGPTGRIHRGGPWAGRLTDMDMLSSRRLWVVPTSTDAVGFRVATITTVPEPSAWALLGVGLLLLLGWLRPWRYSRLSASALVFALLLNCSTAARADLTDSLVGYWPFDGDARDLSGADRNLQLFRGLGFGSGRLGQALGFHGDSSQYAQRPQNDTDFDIATTDFTIQVWVNYAPGPASEQLLVEKFWGGRGPGWTLTSFVRGEDGITFTSPDSIGGIDYRNASILDDVWHHVTIRREGSDLTMMMDGSIVAVEQKTGAMNITNEPLLVGRRNAFQAGHPIFPLNGRLDELAIWNRALSDSEIAFLYNNGAGNPVIVPEPATIALAAIGAFACGLVLKRRQRRLLTKSRKTVQ